MKRIGEALGGMAAACVVLAAIVISLVFSVANDENGGGEAVQTFKSALDPIAQFREEREQVREIERLQLGSITQDESAGEDIKNEARRELIALSRYMEMETTIEGVLAARGMENAVVTVHANSVNVMVPKDEISRSESTMILELRRSE